MQNECKQILEGITKNHQHSHHHPPYISKSNPPANNRINHHHIPPSANSISFDIPDAPRDSSHKKIIKPKDIDSISSKYSLKNELD